MPICSVCQQDKLVKNSGVCVGCYQRKYRAENPEKFEKYKKARDETLAGTKRQRTFKRKAWLKGS